MRRSLHFAIMVGLTLPALTVACAGTGDAGPEPTVTITETETQVVPPTYEEPVQEVPEGSVSEGTYLVGTDVEAGTYRTDGPDGTDWLDWCYFERSTDDSGSLESIIDNDNLSGPGRFTVKDGQVLKLSGSCVWEKQ